MSQIFGAIRKAHTVTTNYTLLLDILLYWYTSVRAKYLTVVLLVLR